MQTKQCSMCYTYKPLTSFYKVKDRKYGVGSRCKKCHCAISTRAYYRHHEKRLQYHKNYYKTNGGISQANYYETVKGQFSAYKGSAKTRNIPFNLTFSQFASFWKKPCTYCGNPIRKIGLDRINNRGAYSIKNVVPCCTFCNRLKHTFTKKDFFAQIKRIYEFNSLANYSNNGQALDKEPLIC